MDHFTAYTGPQIEFRRIRKTFTRTGKPSFPVLDGLDLTVPKGTFVSVLGPSGCGKSTLLNLLAGFDRPTGGQVLVDGEEVTGPGPDRVVVFQEPALFPWLTTAENAAFGLKQKGISKKDRLDRARKELKAVQLDQFSDRYPHELSGGMKQRAALARALAMDPGILLMDEPFAALDEQTRFVLQQDLEALWRTSGKTVVFVTHQIREALVLSDTVVVMGSRPGRILRELPVRLARPRDITDPELVRLEKIIMGDLEHEYHLAKDPLPGSAGSDLGSGI